MAVTLADWARSAPDELDRAVVTSWLKHVDFLQLMPVVGVNGFEAEWLVESRLPSASWRSLNEAFSESTGTLERRRVGIGILGNLVDIDRRFLKAGGSVDQAALQMDMSVRAIGYALADTIVNGSLASNPETFDGLLQQVTVLNNRNSRQVINASGLDLTTGAAREANADTLRFYMHQAIERVRSLCGAPPDFALMSENMKLVVTDCVHRSRAFRTDRDSFGREFEEFMGCRLYAAGFKDPAAGTEIITDTWDGDGYTSILFVKVGEEFTHLIQQGPLEKVHIGPTENGVWDRWLIEYAVGLRVKDNGSICRLRGLDITA